MIKSKASGVAEFHPWYKHLFECPKKPEANLRWRKAILDRANVDLDYRAKVKELFHRDVLFAFNAFFFTLDPRKRPVHHQPFCTYPYQDHTIIRVKESIEKGKDLICDKSRDMGASYLFLYVPFWMWLDPNSYADVLLGSRKKEYVDVKGDMKTLMQKLRYALYKLPVWLRPVGFSRKKHDNFMKLTNPETGASIVGESNNENWGTSGRFICSLMDEAAKWVHTDEAAWTSVGDATPCRLAVSTPFGVGGQFYRLVTAGRTDHIRLHWCLHPEKAAGLYCAWPKPEEAGDVVDWNNPVGLRSPWYDRECRRRQPREIAQDVDIDYIGAGNPAFDGKSGKRLGVLQRAGREATWLEVSGANWREWVELDNVMDHSMVVGVYNAPKPGGSYCIGVDVAEGRESGDFSVIKVLDRDTKSVVASFAHRIDEVQLAGVVKGLAGMYEGRDGCWWAVEANGPGLATFDLCVEMHGMLNAFMMPRYDQAREQISHRKGWWTDVSSRRKLVSGIREWLLNGEGWMDKRCVGECLSFVMKDGKAQAKDGCHDDEVMAFGIALQCDEMVPYDEIKGVEFVAGGLEATAREMFDWLERKEEMSVVERCIATIERKRSVAYGEDYL